MTNALTGRRCRSIRKPFGQRRQVGSLSIVDSLSLPSGLEFRGVDMSYTLPRICLCCLQFSDTIHGPFIGRHFVHLRRSCPTRGPQTRTLSRLPVPDLPTQYGQNQLLEIVAVCRRVLAAVVNHPRTCQLADDKLRLFRRFRFRFSITCLAQSTHVIFGP